MPGTVSRDDMAALHGLVKDDKPAQAIVGKAVEAVRNAADSPAARNGIGKQCSSVVLPSDPNRTGQGAYHSVTVSNVAYHVYQVHATSQRGAWEIAGGESGMLVGDVPVPVAGPKLRRNEPCWCGAKTPDGRRMKYKKCHGK
jgi:hypothetical protein